MNELEMSTYASYGIQLLIKLSVIGIGDLVMLISGFLVAIFALNIQTTAVLIYGMFPFYNNIKIEYSIFNYLFIEYSIN